MHSCKQMKPTKTNWWIKEKLDDYKITENKGTTTLTINNTTKINIRYCPFCGKDLQKFSSIKKNKKYDKKCKELTKKYFGTGKEKLTKKGMSVNKYWHNKSPLLKTKKRSKQNA